MMTPASEPERTAASRAKPSRAGNIGRELSQIAFQVATVGMGHHGVAGADQTGFERSPDRFGILDHQHPARQEITPTAHRSLPPQNHIDPVGVPDAADSPGAASTK